MSIGPANLLSNRAIVRAVVLRSAGLWLAARGMLALVGGSLTLPVSAAIAILLIVLVLVYLDVERRRERVFFANMGLSMSVVLLASAIPPIAGEVLMRLTMHAAA